MSLDDAQHFLFLLIQGYAVHSLRDQRDEKVTRYNKVKKKVKFLKLQLLSIALSNDNMLLHQDYCPDLHTKMKNADFFFLLFPLPLYIQQKAIKSRVIMIRVCVNMQIQNNDNESY